MTVVTAVVKVETIVRVTSVTNLESVSDSSSEIATTVATTEAPKQRDNSTIDSGRVTNNHGPGTLTLVSNAIG